MTEDGQFIPSAIAATAKGSLRRVLSAGDANELFSSMLRRMTLDCVEAGSWMIGHIKANVRSGDEMLSMSSTTDDGNVRLRYSFGKDVKDYAMTANLIVYGVERHKAAEIFVTNVKRTLGDAETEVHSEIGCEDPGCSDPMCSDAGHERIIKIT